MLDGDDLKIFGFAIAVLGTIAFVAVYGSIQGYCG